MPSPDTSYYRMAEMPVDNPVTVLPELDELPTDDIEVGIPDMPSDLPLSPETPPFVPPNGLPLSPDMPPFAPPNMLPESPETLPLEPPSYNPPTMPPNIPIIMPPIVVPILPYSPENANNGYCNIRFLYAATGQGPVNIAIGKRSVVNSLRFGNLTTYTTEAAGLVTITVRNANVQRVIMNQTSFNMNSGGLYTVAIVNSPTGVALFRIEDTSCNRVVYDSCIRVVNLSDNAPPMDIMLSDGRVLYKDVRFKDITPYRAINPGTYTVMAAESNRCNVPTFQLNEVVQVIPVVIGGGVNTCYSNIVLTSRITVESDRIYTLYIIGNPYSYPFLQFVYAQSYLEP